MMLSTAQHMLDFTDRLCIAIFWPFHHDYSRSAHAFSIPFVCRIALVRILCSLLARVRPISVFRLSPLVVGHVCFMTFGEGHPQPTLLCRHVHSTPIIG